MDKFDFDIKIEKIGQEVEDKVLEATAKVAREADHILDIGLLVFVTLITIMVFVISSLIFGWNYYKEAMNAAKSYSKYYQETETKVYGKTEDERSKRLSLLEPRANSKTVILNVPILMYHYVGEPIQQTNLYKSLTVSADDFRSQMQYLKDNGYIAVSFSDLYKALYYGEKLPEKPVILTFDDGYKDNYTNAFPILKSLGFTGTFFVVNGFIGGNDLYMNWDEISLLDKGGMDIEPHGMNHSNMATLTKNELYKELGDSKKIIEEKFKKQVTTFSYPGGGYNDQVIEVLKEVGYFMGVATEFDSTQNSDHPYELTRIRIDGRNGIESFKASLP